MDLCFKKKRQVKTKTDFLVSANQTIKSIESDQQHKINKNIALPTADGAYSALSLSVYSHQQECN